MKKKLFWTAIHETKQKSKERKVRVYAKKRDGKQWRPQKHKSVMPVLLSNGRRIVRSLRWR